jgi:hypothetical protein
LAEYGRKSVIKESCFSRTSSRIQQALWWFCFRYLGQVPVNQGIVRYSTKLTCICNSIRSNSVAAMFIESWFFIFEKKLYYFQM